MLETGFYTRSNIKTMNEIFYPGNEHNQESQVLKSEFLLHILQNFKVSYFKNNALPTDFAKYEKLLQGGRFSLSDFPYMP